MTLVPADPKVKTETEAFNPAHQVRIYKAIVARSESGLDPISRGRCVDMFKEVGPTLAAFDKWLADRQVDEARNRKTADDAEAADKAEGF